VVTCCSEYNILWSIPKMGAAAGARRPDPLPRPAGISRPSRGARHTRHTAETMWLLAWPTERPTSGPASRHPALKRTAWGRCTQVSHNFLPVSHPSAGLPWLKDKLREYVNTRLTQVIVEMVCLADAVRGAPAIAVHLGGELVCHGGDR
jgi:hypothetical protein